MKLLYCGFNGFGQCPSSSANITPRLTEFPLAGVEVASVSWSCMAVLSGSEVRVSGFVGGQTHQLRHLTLPDQQQALQVSCSREHVLVVVPSGDCWRYCIKSGEWRRIKHFTTVERELGDDTTIDPVVRVCCGTTFSVALSESVEPKGPTLTISRPVIGHDPVVPLNPIPPTRANSICGEVLHFGRAFVLPSPIYQPGTRVTWASCGNEHCVLLTETGQVFSWGSGSRGQLGHGDLESEHEIARQVDMLAGLRVTRVAAGGWHSAAITECGDLYTWGWNHSGQLGFPMGENTVGAKQEKVAGPKKLKTQDTQCTDIVTVLNVPMPVDWTQNQEVNVKDVSCGSRHTIVLLDDSTVWGCGWNAYGQLGTSPEQVPSSWRMRRLQLPDGSSGTVTSLECGAWSTAVFLT